MFQRFLIQGTVSLLSLFFFFSLSFPKMVSQISASQSKRRDCTYWQPGKLLPQFVLVLQLTL